MCAEAEGFCEDGLEEGLVEEAGGIEGEVVVAVFCLACFDFFADFVEEVGVFEDFEGAPVGVEGCVGACAVEIGQSVSLPIRTPSLRIREFGYVPKKKT